MQERGRRRQLGNKKKNNRGGHEKDKEGIQSMKVKNKK
jgi:hypothetical protein